LFGRFTRRALIGLATLSAASAATPALASAAEGLTIAPANLQAGGNPTITSTLTFAPAAGDTTKTVVTALAPGTLTNANANPTCLLAQQLNASCQIGTATVSVTPLGPVPGKLYLVPGQPGDAAGLEVVAAPLPNQYIGVSVRSTDAGLNLTATLPDTRGLGIAVTGFTMVFNPTLGSQPLTRLPTSCSPATSTMTVTYYGSTVSPGASTSSFTPTGCPLPTYTPTLSVQAIKDPGADNFGGEIISSVTQPNAAAESASKTVELDIPPSVISPNAAVIPSCLPAGCVVGTASATSPLLPIPLIGNVTLAGNILAPTLTITFPPPFGISLAGSLNILTGATTFANVPDFPLTALVLDITGPPAGRAFVLLGCSGSFGAKFTPQDGGAARTVSGPISFFNCATGGGGGGGGGTTAKPPTAKGALSGLAAGHPKLRLTVKHGTKAPNVSSLSIGLTGGLSFSRKGFVKHRKCTGTGSKRTCRTIIVVKGLSIAGARLKKAALRGGRLVISLKKPAASASLTVRGPLLAETSTLRQKVSKHKVNKLSVSLKVTDTKPTTTSLVLKLGVR
jgi:hypothetical protein